MKEKILSLPSPAGTPAELYKFSWGEAGARQSLSMVSGLHGNQLNGVYLSSRLILFLDRVAAGKIADYRLTGEVRIFPAVNHNALTSGTRLWSYDDLDMDLAFPGNETGEPGERIAATIAKHSRGTRYGIILPTAPDHYEDAPHVNYLRSDGSAKDMARFLGLTVARGLGETDISKLALFSHWIENDVTALVVSAGAPGTIDRTLCDSLFERLVDLLTGTGILSSDKDRSKNKEVEFYTSKNEVQVTADSAGLFLPAVRVGTRLEQGEKIGEIREMPGGNTLEEITAPAKGFLVTLRRYPMVYEKESVATLLTRKPPWFWPFGRK